MTTLQLYGVLLPGVVMETSDVHDGQLVITCHREGVQACCPSCQRPSQRVHSYRWRVLKDLPVFGFATQLRLRVRRFRCGQADCERHTFTECLSPLAKRWAHRTERLRVGLHRIGMMLGGEAGARLAGGLAMPVGGVSLLRLLREAQPRTPISAHTHLGIDDWAWRRGQSYGTLIIDLLTHRPVEVLPDRSAETLAAWLRTQPAIEIIARDRASDFARAAAEGAPAAQQVADRWHLLRNLRQVLERLCQRLHPELQQLPVSAEMQGKTTWSARDRSGRRASTEEARKLAVYDQRQARFEATQRLKAAGWSIKQIARELGVSWATARDDYQRKVFPPLAPARRRASRLDPFAAYLQTRWDAGCRNANQLWREICAKGYLGSHRMVMLWAQVRRDPAERRPGRPRFNAPLPSGMQPGQDLPAAGPLAWLLVCRPEKLDKDSQTLLMHVRQQPLIAKAYDLAQEFATMLRDRQPQQLEDWLTRSESSPVPDLFQFATGLRKDLAAVRAALTLPWSSGPIEGNVTRLKLIKRQMYGRAHLDLLRIRVLGQT